MSTDYIIRTAVSKDVDDIANLMIAHAQYEESLIQSEGLPDRFEKHLSAPEKDLQCLVVEHENKLVGYTTFMQQFSTWDADYYIYLDCIYLDKQARGMHIGQELMMHIKAYAKAIGCSQIQWQTPVFNKKAIRFYTRLGALTKAKERFFWEV